MYSGESMQLQITVVVGAVRTLWNNMNSGYRKLQKFSSRHVPVISSGKVVDIHKNNLERVTNTISSALKAYSFKYHMDKLTFS